MNDSNVLDRGRVTGARARSADGPQGPHPSSPRRRPSAGVVPTLLFAAFSAVVYFAGVASPKPSMFVLLFLVNAYAASRKDPAPSTTSLVAVGASVVLPVLATIQPHLLPISDPQVVERITRYYVLTPLAFLTGWVILRDGSYRHFSRAYLAVSLVVSVLALVERVAGLSLFGRADILEGVVRGGVQRAVVGAEHPLVLGSLLLVGLVFALRLGPLPARLVAVPVCLGGIFATGSRGPLILGALLVLVVLLVAKYRIPPHWGTTLGLVTLPVLVVGLTLSVGTGGVNSTNVATASAQYRSVIYLALVDQISNLPFGFGLSGLPPGLLLISTAQGTVDLSTSLDSEIVATGFEFGVLGIVAFVAVWVVGVRGLLAGASDLGGAAALSATGLFLSLHVWAGLGTLWAFLIGASFAVLTRRPQKTVVLGTSLERSG